MVRYGIIGSGMMAQEHMRNLALIEGAQVTGIADPNEGMRFAASKIAPDAAAFTDYKELLSADLCDVYLIAGPNDLHHQMMQDVLPTGKPILCEKPLCTTSEDCRDIMAKAEGRAAPLQRYDLHSETPDVIFARRVHYTPTFILVDNGRELDRIEGYPGEDFFWGLLTMMFENAGIPLELAS